MSSAQSVNLFHVKEQGWEYMGNFDAKKCE